MSLDLLPKVLEAIADVEKKTIEVRAAETTLRDTLIDMVLPMLPLKVGDDIKTRTKTWRITKIYVRFGGHFTKDDVRIPYANISYFGRNILKSGELGQLNNTIYGWDLPDQEWRAKFFIEKLHLL